jgi:hypothetical protein
MEKVEGIRLDKDGLPQALPDTNKLFLRGTTYSYRVVLTWLTLTRAVQLPPKVDTKPITDP